MLRYDLPATHIYMSRETAASIAKCHNSRSEEGNSVWLKLCTVLSCPRAPHQRTLYSFGVALRATYKGHVRTPRASDEWRLFARTDIIAMLYTLPARVLRRFDVDNQAEDELLPPMMAVAAPVAAPNNKAAVASYTCNICYSDISSAENRRRLATCGCERTCVSCLQHMARDVLRTGMPFGCPTILPGTSKPCGEPLALEDVVAVAPDVVDQYATHVKRQELEITRAAFACTATAGCTGLVMRSGSSSSSSSSTRGLLGRYDTCWTCGATHCLRCHVPLAMHGGQSPDACEQNRAALVKKVVAELAADGANAVKTCPSCLHPVVKDHAGDCNAMRCTFCAAHFCWLCGTVTVTREREAEIGRSEASTMTHAHFCREPEYIYGAKSKSWFEEVKACHKPQCMASLGSLDKASGYRGDMMHWRADGPSCLPWPEHAPPLYTKPSEEEVAKLLFG